MHVVSDQDVGAIFGAALPGVNGNEAVATGAVFHHHGLAPAAREFVGHQAGHTVRATTDRERRDDANRLGGEVLCGGNTRQHGSQGDGTQCQAEAAGQFCCGKFHGMSLKLNGINCYKFNSFLRLSNMRQKPI